MLIRLQWRLVLAVCGVMMADSNSIVERPSFLLLVNVDEKPCMQTSHWELKPAPFLSSPPAPHICLMGLFPAIEKRTLTKEKGKSTVLIRIIILPAIGVSKEDRHLQ